MQRNLIRKRRFFEVREDGWITQRSKQRLARKRDEKSVYLVVEKALTAYFAANSLVLTKNSGQLHVTCSFYLPFLPSLHDQACFDPDCECGMYVPPWITLTRSQLEGWYKEVLALFFLHPFVIFCQLCFTQTLTRKDGKFYYVPST